MSLLRHIRMINEPHEFIKIAWRGTIKIIINTTRFEFYFITNGHYIGNAGEYAELFFAR